MLKKGLCHRQNEKLFLVVVTVFGAKDQPDYSFFFFDVSVEEVDNLFRPVNRVFDYSEAFREVCGFQK